MVLRVWPWRHHLQLVRNVKDWPYLQSTEPEALVPGALAVGARLQSLPGWHSLPVPRQSPFSTPGRGGRREPTKGAGAAPGARATPSRPRRPRPPPATRPLGWGAGTVAMAAALGKLQLGNYCEHPSCRCPPWSRASSRGQAAPPRPPVAAPWPGAAPTGTEGAAGSGAGAEEGPRGWQEPARPVPAPAPAAGLTSRSREGTWLFPAAALRTEPPAPGSGGCSPGRSRGSGACGSDMGSGFLHRHHPLG